MEIPFWVKGSCSKRNRYLKGHMSRSCTTDYIIIIIIIIFRKGTFSQKWFSERPCKKSLAPRKKRIDLPKDSPLYDFPLRQDCYSMYIWLYLARKYYQQKILVISFGVNVWMSAFSSWFYIFDMHLPYGTVAFEIKLNYLHKDITVLRISRRLWKKPLVG